MNLFKYILNLSKNKKFVKSVWTPEKKKFISDNLIKFLKKLLKKLDKVKYVLDVIIFTEFLIFIN